MDLNRDSVLPSSSARVALRFCVRLAILAALAAIAHTGFRSSFPIFLIAGGAFCAVWAALHREQLFSSTLTHWDEAAVFVMLGKLAFRFL
jgi:hypothetical protein